MTNCDKLVSRSINYLINWPIISALVLLLLDNLRKLCLQARKTHKHASHHQRQPLHHFPPALYFSEGVSGRQRLHSCPRGVYEQEDQQMCSSGYDHNRGSGVFWRCWQAKEQKTCCVVLCCVHYLNQQLLVGQSSGSRGSSFDLLSASVKMRWNPKVEMTVFKWLPSNDRHVGAFLFFFFFKHDRTEHSSLRRSSTLSWNDTQFILSIKAHGLRKPPHLSACRSWEPSCRVLGWRESRHCSRWLTVLSVEGINEVGAEGELTRMVR